MNIDDLRLKLEKWEREEQEFQKLLEATKIEAALEKLERLYAY